MFDAHTIFLFCAASLLLALSPGPDNLFVLAQSAMNGWRTGLLVTLGLCTGLLLHTVAAALGVAALIRASPRAFSLLTGAGAMYLIYLAWDAFRTGARTDPPENRQEGRRPKFYLRGILMNVTNPRVSLFFLAYLPQFTRPERGVLPLQMVLLGGLFMASTLAVFLTISLLAGWIGDRLRRSPRIYRTLHLASGVLFIGLALKLTLERI